MELAKNGAVKVEEDARLEWMFVCFHCFLFYNFFTSQLLRLEADKESFRSQLEAASRKRKVELEDELNSRKRKLIEGEEELNVKKKKEEESRASKVVSFHHCFNLYLMFQVFKDAGEFFDNVSNAESEPTTTDDVVFEKVVSKTSQNMKI